MPASLRRLESDFAIKGKNKIVNPNFVGKTRTYKNWWKFRKEDDDTNLFFSSENGYTASRCVVQCQMNPIYQIFGVLLGFFQFRIPKNMLQAQRCTFLDWSPQDRFFRTLFHDNLRYFLIVTCKLIFFAKVRKCLFLEFFSSNCLFFANYVSYPKRLSPRS